MYNKGNIKQIIAKHDKEILELQIEIAISESELVKKTLKSKISYLTDNRNRYAMQAKKWGIEVGN